MMVTLNAGGSGEAPTPAGSSFNSTARTMVAKNHPLGGRRRRVGKGTISGYGGYKSTGANVVESSSARQSASSNPDPSRGGTVEASSKPPTPAPSSSSTQGTANQPQHSNETPPAPEKPCHSARMSILCCQNSIRMGARAQLGLCPPGRPRRALQAALRQRTRSSSNPSHPSQLNAMSRRLAVSSTDPNGYYAIEKMIGTQSLDDYEDQEEDYLLSTNTFDVESDEEASSGDEDELSTIEALLAPDSSVLDDESKYANLREPLFTPIGVDGSMNNPNGASMGGMGSGASGKLPFNRRKIRYFDGITAQDRQAARDYLNEEASKARKRSAILLKRHLRRMQKEERRKRRMQKGETIDNDTTDNEIEDPRETELVEGGVSHFEQPMTSAMSAALILESLALHPLESIEGMAKCYDGIVAAGVALLESQRSDQTLGEGEEKDKPKTSRADVLAALAPLLITSLDQPSGDVILLLARMRQMCGTPRYQRRFVQRVAPCLVRPKNAAMWCLRHQHDMEPIVAATELIFDAAHTIFGKGWYEKGQLFLADSKRAETLNSAAAQLRNLSGEPSSEGLSLGLSTTHHGIRRYMSGASQKDQKSSKDQLAEWEVMAVDKEIRLSISKIMSSDWNRVNLNTKDSDSVRSFRRTASTNSKRPAVLPQSSSGDASPRAMLSPRSPSRPMGAKTPLSPPPPKDFNAPAPPAETLFENIMPTQPLPAERPTSPDNAFVQKNSNVMVTSPPAPHRREGNEEMEPKSIPITSSTPPRSPKSPMRESVEQAPPLAKLSSNNAPTPFTPISPRRNKALSPPSSQNIKDGNEGKEMVPAPFAPSLGTTAVAPLSPSSIGTNSTSELMGYRPSSSVSVMSAGSAASQSAHYRTLTSTASERKRTVAACRALRAQITSFEDAFIQLHGRPPKGAAERAPLATTYSQYREWKRAIRADAACRIQALFRGARTRWVLLRSEDPRISDIVHRRAGRKHTPMEQMEQAPRQATSQSGLFLPNEIGESDHSRGSTLKPSANSSLGSAKATSSVEDPFAGQPSSPMLSPQTQWASEVVRRRAASGRTPDGFPATTIAPQPHTSPLSSPSTKASADASALSLSELQAKKRELKQQLKQYDMTFARKNGRMPVKSEKEPIRHLYENYNALKSQIALLEQEGGRPNLPVPAIQQLNVNAAPPPSRFMAAPPTPPDSSDSDRSIDSSGLLGSATRGKRKQLKSPPIAASSTPPGATQDLAALKAEKGQLHQMLRSYEKDFFKEHKRQVSSFADIKPVASQYRRYKEIKKAITALQGSNER